VPDLDDDAINRREEENTHKERSAGISTNLPTKKGEQHNNKN
jgi:hypothetical protein